MQWLEALKDWVLTWANTPYGAPMLFGIAVLEATVFFVPPDVLLIALAVGAPDRALFFALVCSCGSVLGGMCGYSLGMFFKPTLVDPMVNFFRWHRSFERARELYRKHDAAAVATAGFTPIPYWVFAVSAGIARIRFHRFVVATALSRSARFFLVAGLIFAFGKSIRPFIDRYFQWLTLLLVGLVIAGLLGARYLTRERREVQTSKEPPGDS
jgi:membrane protein YqaA with SNARE-associated domain